VARETLVITGSSTVAPVISDLAKVYEKKSKNLRIDVQTGGSSRGILDVRRGMANLGMISRTLNKQELDLHSYAFAVDGLALIVHKSNKVVELGRQQITKIFQGKIRNWREVGGHDAQIVVVNKAEGRSTLEIFLKFFTLKNSQIRADIIIGDNEQGIKVVSTNKLAIGYVSLGAAEYNASHGVAIKLLDYQGVKASVKNIENRTYPLMRELNLVTKFKPSGQLAAFIEFVRSTDAQVSIKDHFFVPLH